MAQALIEHEQITTTLPKAQGPASGRREAGHARQARRPARPPPGDRADQGRRAGRRSSSRSSARATRRNGGYLRIMKAGFRFGDNAPMADHRVRRSRRRGQAEFGRSSRRKTRRPDRPLGQVFGKGGPRAASSALALTPGRRASSPREIDQGVDRLNAGGRAPASRHKARR